MNICRNCNTETENPSFCTRSCSAAYNNRKAPKRKRMSGLVCENCSGIIKHCGRKFCSRFCQQEYNLKERRTRAEEDGYFQGSVKSIKNILFWEYGTVCCICENTHWNGKDIPLVMDHIDGNAENWSVDNLRLVCGNCDMQLPTYKGKNKGNGRHTRRERYKNGLSY